MIIDTHAHLYWESFQTNFDEVIKRALENNVSTIINVGVDIEKSQIALDQISNQLSNYPQLTAYSTIGIHPHEAWRYQDEKILKEDLAILEKIYYQNPEKVVAVGECGLDFFFDNNPDFIPSSLSIEDQKILQIKLLNSQIELAKKLNLPLVIHSRDDRSKDPQNTECWDKIIELTKDHFGIYHCYSGLPQTTQKILQQTNFYISFASTITYPRNEYLKQAVQDIPLEKIVVETDCPFLPPQPKRGQRNEPSFIVETVKTISQIKNLSLEEVENQTTQNAKACLKLN